MFQIIVLFFTDAEYFRSAVSIGGARGWSLLVLVATVIQTGMIPELTQALGSAGSWGSRVMLMLGLVRALASTNAEPTPAAAKAMAYVDPEMLRAHLLALGVPMAVANTAAEKTAVAEPPKV